MRHSVRFGASLCALAFVAAGCSSPEDSPKPSESPSSTTVSPTSTTETSQRQSQAPQVRAGGTPRIGELCPNQIGEVRAGANGQALECATIGGQAMWTVKVATEAPQQPEATTWIPTTAHQPEHPSYESPTTTTTAHPGGEHPTTETTPQPEPTEEPESRATGAETTESDWMDLLR